jgi:hypothetical protein
VCRDSLQPHNRHRAFDFRLQLVDQLQAVAAQNGVAAFAKAGLCSEVCNDVAQAVAKACDGHAFWNLLDDS